MIPKAIKRRITSSRSRPVVALLDQLVFTRRALRSARANRLFRREHPNFPLPPLRLLWDAQSYTDFATYHRSGQEGASMYWSLMKTHLSVSSDRRVRVCEWGCGPGRIIRHLPALSAGYQVDIFATDYNRRSVRWCQANIRGVEFRPNDLAPPLPFEDDFLDVLYCRSVFTHLSEDMHYRWMAELRRVVRSGGLLIFSTTGQVHVSRMTPEERLRYDRGELVVRGLAKEGSLMFSVFHNPEFVRHKLVAGLEIIEHQAGQGTQDIWIVRNDGAPG